MTVEKLGGERFICGGAEAAGLVFEDGLAVAGGFGEADAAGDDGLENHVAEMRLDFGDDLGGEVVAHEHGHEHATDGEVGVCATVADLLDDVGDFAQPFEGEIFALERDEEFVRGGKGVGHQDAERGRAIEEDEVERGVVAEGLERGAEAGEVLGGAGDFDLGTGEVEVAGDEPQVLPAGGDDFFRERAVAGEGAVNGQSLRRRKAEGAGGVGLRIKVDEEDARAAGGEAGREIDGGRGFAHAAFLIGDRDDFHRGADCSEERCFDEKGNAGRVGVIENGTWQGRQKHRPVFPAEKPLASWQSVASVGGRFFPDAMIPITERFLSECGGWQALRDARGLHAAGRVLAASYAPPLLEGRVREGDGELRSGLRITSASHVENLCTCRASRRDGVICAHALAVGLAWLKPPAVAAPAAPVKAVATDVGPHFSTDEGEPLELHLVLPPNFAAAWERNAITLGIEGATGGRRVLLSALASTKSYRVSTEDLPVLAKLRALADGALPGIATIDRTAFLDLLPTLTSHPRVTFAKTTPAAIHREPFDTASGLPSEAVILAGGTSAWLLHGHAFHPLAPESTTSAPAPSDIAPPRFALTLEGSLNHLTARLDALYGEDRFSVEATPPRTAKTPRHHTVERAALDRLLTAGFTGPDRTAQLVLKGEPAILAFFARDLPRLEKEWAVTIGERFAHVTRDIERIQPRLEIRTSGENWFDLQYELATPGGDRFSAAEIQRLLQSGQNSTRLKNRKLAVFDPGMLDEFQEALTDCNPDQRQPGLYRIDRRHAPFLDGMAKEQGGEVRSDQSWKEWVAPPDEEWDSPSTSLGSFESILRPYQKDGVKWLNSLFNRGLNGLLADEMGLGKTVQTLAFLSGIAGKSLVVCPSSLVFNWEREAARFAPKLRTLAIQGAERNPLFGDPLKAADLVITSYALLRRDIDRYRDTEFSAVVLDEAQHIKNPNSQNAQSAFSLKAKRRLALTGTPVENSLADIWSLMNFLMPGYLGSRQDFRERFQRPIEGAQGSAIHRRLIKRLEPCILRRLKKNVLTELPDKIEHVFYCELTSEQRAAYSQLANSTRRQVSEWSGAKDQAKARMLMLTALLRLRQTCCDLRLLSLAGPEPSEPSGKLLMLEELLNEAIDGGHRVLIFSQFTSMLRLLRDTLTRLEIPQCYLDGQTKDRAAEVDRFESGAASVFLISLKAGGTGLNLTTADTVIHFDPWWNPAVESQATDRAHRIGQKKVVTSYKLICRDTVEEKILALQARKRTMIDTTLDHEQPLMEGLSTDAIRELLA